MSYDLFFRGTLPSAADLRAFLGARPHMHTGAQSASYIHPLSEASFSLSWEGEPLERLSFNMPYVRPGWFARAVEPELSALIAAFDLGIDDPQGEGMGQGPYSRAGFLRGWRFGNDWATSVMQSMGVVDPKAPRLPRAQNLAVWAWNEALADLRAAFEEALDPCFVPQIFLFELPKVAQRPVRAVAWTGDMALALPEVDLIVLPKTIVWVQDLGSALADYPAESRSLERPVLQGVSVSYRALRFPEVPAELSALVQAASKKRPSKLARVDYSAVLDAENLQGSGG